ncbi:hypothetical protein D0T66_08175 [Dysgonomonas sp. 25]|nr:hypothetical protein [Dysgonomonas sp. 25]
MLPRLLRRGYDCISPAMTLVKKHSAKAIFKLTFINLHLKVEAINKDRTRSLVSTRDDNKAIGYQLMAKSYKNLLTHKLTLL